MKMVSVVVITSTVDSIVKTSVLGFRNYIFTLIFIDRPVISFGARKINKKMLIVLKLSRSNTLGTLLIFYKERFKNCEITLQYGGHTCLSLNAGLCCICCRLVYKTIIEYSYLPNRKVTELIYLLQTIPTCVMHLVAIL
jgi:hypothetical protein